MTMMFDTLRLTDDFKAVGFAEPQARALADKFRQLTDDHLVTKEYLDFKLKELRFDIDVKFNTMTLRLGGLMTAVIVFFKVMDHFWR